MLALSIGNAWGESWTYTFKSPDAVKNNSITVNGATWNVNTTVGTGSPTISTGTYSKTYGLKFGSSKTNYYKTVVFTTDYFNNYNVSEVVVKILLNGGVNTTLTTKQGDITIGSASFKTSQQWTELTTNTTKGSGGQLSLTIATTQAFYISSIIVNYEIPSVTPDPVDPTATFSNGSYTVGQTLDLSTLWTSNSDGAVTYSIVEAGTTGASINGKSFTATAAGTCTVKASQAATSAYNAIAKTSTITVSAPTPAKITLSEAGQEKTVEGKYVGDSYTLPSTSTQTCGTKTFVGWSTVTIDKSSTKPTTNFYEPGASVTLVAEQTYYYAVYAEGDGSDIFTSISGGDWSNGVSGGSWTTKGTGTYSGNGVKFDDKDDYVMSPDISSNAYTRLLLKFNSGHNGGEGSVLAFYVYNASNTWLTGDNVTISPETVVPKDVYTSQQTIYQVSVSANEVIGKIMIRMDSKTKNLGMKYCEIFGVSSSYFNYSTTCVSETDLTDAQFAWSAASAMALKGADNNVFPTLTNALGLTVTYESSNTSVATIESDGKITLLAPGTTTISAAFAGGEVSGTKYAAKTVTYTLTVKQLVSCADIYDLADDATFVLKDFVVTYVNGKYTYIKDGTGYGLIYKDSYGLNAGDQVASGKFEGKRDSYEGLVEIIPTTVSTDLNAAFGEAPAPDVLNTNPTTDNINQYVKFEKVQFTTTKLNSSTKSILGTIQGQTDKITFFNQFGKDVTFDTSKKYSVVGVVSIYQGNVQVNFISAEEVAEPTLNVKITNADFGKIAINGKAERTLTLNGSLLTKPVSLAIEGEYFTLASNSVTPVDSKIEEEKIKITYKPTVEGTHTATLKITSDELAEQTITLRGQAVQQHTVDFYVNKEKQTELAKKVLSGEKLTEIPTATSCDPLEYPTFIGWSASEITGTTDVEPTDLLDLNTTITADCKYYAVFAKETSSTISTGITYEVTLKNTNFVTNYSDRTINITANEVGGDGTVEVSFQSVGVMKCTDASKGAVMQFRKKSSSSQPGIIYNTTDLGQINSITIGTGGTNNIASIVIGSTQQPTTQEDNEGFFLITNGTSVSYIPSITINFTQNSSASTTTYTYLTTCESATPTYTVTYNLDGGESTCETSVVVEQDGELTLCDAPTKTGHKFLKWKDQNDNEYAAGAKITVSEDLTLTAQWQVNSYEVTWMSLGSKLSSSDVDYNAQPTKPATNPTYLCGTDKEFVGWSTQEIEGVGTPAYLYTDDFPAVKADVTYHAVFATKSEDGGSLAKATSLTNGEIVYLATESGIGVTGANTSTNKDATVSTTQGDWMPFTVVTNGLQYQFKTGDNYITAAAKSFKITNTPSDFAFENGYIVYNVPSGSDPGDYVLLYNSNSGSFYRFYKKSNIGKENYETFYVYKNPTHTDYVTSCEEVGSDMDNSTLVNPSVESGIFSVDEGKYVQFSTGNLQYEVGTNTWSFASEQYEVIGGETYDPANPTNTNYGMNEPGYTGKLDLFAWSCDDKFGVNPSNADADYKGEFEDWGKLVDEEGWYTLTKDEMNYILNRKKDGKKLWALATVCGMNGLILLPDNWNTSTTLEYGYVPADFNYTQNQLDAAAWAALEAAGAVFLPEGGSRVGGHGNKDNATGPSLDTPGATDAHGHYFHVDNVGEMGYYWLNTQDTRTGYENCASFLILPGWSDNGTPNDESDDKAHAPQVWSREKRRGNSVRLVKEVTPNYTRED